MTDIDWDDIARAADDTPASMLAEVLGRADEWVTLMIVAVDKDDTLRRWAIGSDHQILAMIDMAHYYTMRAIAAQGDDQA